MDLDIFDRKQIFWTSIAVLILAITVYIADIEKVLSAISSSDPRYIFFTVLLGMVILFLRSQVWFEIFEKLDLEISKTKSFYLFSSGELLNNVTPLGQAGGQPFMAYIISNNSKLEYEKSLASVVSADFMTGFPLLSFGLMSGIYFLLNGHSEQMILQIAGFSIVAISTGTLLVYLLWFKSGYIESKILKISKMVLWKDRWIEKIEKKLKNIEETFEMIGENPRDLIRPSIYAHLSFLTDILVLYIVMLSLGLSINPLYLFIVFPIANLSKSAPTSGGSGVYELALGSIIAILLNIDFSVAVASALLYRLSTYWVAIVWGTYTISKLNHSS